MKHGEAPDRVGPHVVRRDCHRQALRGLAAAVAVVGATSLPAHRHGDVPELRNSVRTAATLPCNVLLHWQRQPRLRGGLDDDLLQACGGAPSLPLEPDRPDSPIGGVVELSELSHAPDSHAHGIEMSDSHASTNDVWTAPADGGEQDMAAGNSCCAPLWQGAARAQAPRSPSYVGAQRKRWIDPEPPAEDSNPRNRSRPKYRSEAMQERSPSSAVRYSTETNQPKTPRLSSGAPRSPDLRGPRSSSRGGNMEDLRARAEQAAAAGPPSPLPVPAGPNTSHGAAERDGQVAGDEGSPLGKAVGNGRARRDPARISEILEQVIAACADELPEACQHGEDGRTSSAGSSKHVPPQQASPDVGYLRLSEVLGMLGPAAFPVLIFLLCIPNMVGMPGLSLFLGATQGMLALEMLAGRRVPSLPEWMLAWRVKKRLLRSLLACVLPAVRFLATYMRQRWLLVHHPVVEQLLAAFICQYSVVIMLPIPLSQQAPAACLALIALGMAELDGACVVVGLVLAILAEVMVFRVVTALVPKIVLFLSSKWYRRWSSSAPEPKAIGRGMLPGGPGGQGPYGASNVRTGVNDGGMPGSSSSSSSTSNSGGSGWMGGAVGGAEGEGIAEIDALARGDGGGGGSGIGRWWGVRWLRGQVGEEEVAVTGATVPQRDKVSSRSKMMPKAQAKRGADGHAGTQSLSAQSEKDTSRDAAMLSSSSPSAPSASGMSEKRDLMQDTSSLPQSLPDKRPTLPLSSNNRKKQ